jgi:outer membrane usher protein
MLSVNLQKDGGGGSQGVQVQKNAPVGEGFGYRVSASREDRSDSRSLFVNPYAQYNGPYGIYSAEFSGKYPTGATNSSESIRLNASGGIACVGRTIAFGRPISDSYGVVKVGDLKGVRVYHNNHLIGRTDGTGKALIPVMASYQDNHVSIDDRDIPVEYSLEKVGKYVSPPLRSGTFLSFDAVRLRAFTGRIERRTREGTAPLGLCEAKLTVDGKEVPFVTDGQGEFYLENIPAGSHRGSIEKAGRTYYITIRIPRSDDTMVDLGGILAEERH